MFRGLSQISRSPTRTRRGAVAAAILSLVAWPADGGPPWFSSHETGRALVRGTGGHRRSEG